MHALFLLLFSSLFLYARISFFLVFILFTFLIFPLPSFHLFINRLSAVFSLFFPSPLSLLLFLSPPSLLFPSPLLPLPFISPYFPPHCSLSPSFPLISFPIAPLFPTRAHAYRLTWCVLMALKCHFYSAIPAHKRTIAAVPASPF